MQGMYCLIISVRAKGKVNTASLGKIEFEKGYWLYIGSAQGTGSTSLENRIRRHFRNEKKIHWHIDHLLETNAKIIEAIWAETSEDMECVIAQHLEGLEDFIWGPKGFGASDCTKSCSSHLLYYQGKGKPLDQIETAFQHLKLIPRRYSDIKPITR
ncbi:MAG: GIY-YIG nuclease family protein [Candidatus Thorarchaeota archaeon]|nr:GIY-YIG nuclease family protein [Candidatus Thorarchaeota archaeon]